MHLEQESRTSNPLDEGFEWYRVRRTKIALPLCNYLLYPRKLFTKRIVLNHLEDSKRRTWNFMLGSYGPYRVWHIYHIAQLYQHLIKACPQPLCDCNCQHKSHQHIGIGVIYCKADILPSLIAINDIASDLRRKIMPIVLTIGTMITDIAIES